jgi:hypothetical protein
MERVDILKTDIPAKASAYTREIETSYRKRQGEQPEKKRVEVEKKKPEGQEAILRTIKVSDEAKVDLRNFIANL